MKILLVTSSTGWSGGQHQVYLLAKGLKIKGHDVSIVTSTGSELGKRLSNDGFDVHFLRMNKEADMFSIFRMTGILKTLKPDIINVHRPTAHTIAMISNMLSIRSKFFVTRRVSYGIPSRISAKIKYEWFVHGVIAISNDVKDSLIRTGVNEDIISLIPDAVDTDFFNPEHTAPAQGFDNHGTIIGTVGNANPQKGHKYLIEAMPAILKKHPEALLVDVGVSDQDIELSELAKNLDMGDRIIFTGNRHDVRPYLKAMDIFVFPSLVEGLGTAMLEAMSMKKPVIASRSGGMIDAIDDGRTGMLIEPASPDEIANAVCRLIDNPDYRTNLGTNAREAVIKNFSVNVVTEKTLKLFESVL
ncbi:MAG: glycosyltransferase family 4 protein [Deltaproteobacteria bacterium]|nr:glycosyltransferase family 4 protein [Deltaproteobacteria bacterium]MCL5791589.1 glycosyltransferase family 4 protein [Deltaproteobacteria bacterium]